MLNAKYRFHSRGGVQATLRQGQTLRGEKLALVWAPNTRRGTRFGVVVSKKVLKSAVGRNRVRRRVYEVLRLWLQDQPRLPQLDGLVVVYDAGLATMPFAELQSKLTSLLVKAVSA